MHEPLTRVNSLVDNTLSELRSEPPTQLTPELWDVCIDAVIDIHNASSKQLVRPQLVFLGGSWDQPANVGLDLSVLSGESGVPAGLEMFAAGLELQHLFMMVHDDVIDNATRRRGLPPVHLSARVHGREWGVRPLASYHLATIIGDVLYTKAIALMHSGCEEAGSHSALASVLQDGVRTGFGQFVDIVGWTALQSRGFAGGNAMDVVDALLLDKSGRTTMCSPLLAGMQLQGADAESMAVAEEWGCQAGIALQAIDDVADLVVEQGTIGKDSFQDFRDQRLTLLLFLLWDRAGDTDDWSELQALWRGVASTRGGGDTSALLPHERRSIMHMLERHGVIPAAFDFARSRLDRAEAVLDKLPSDKTLCAGLGRFTNGIRSQASALETVIAHEAEEAL